MKEIKLHELPNIIEEAGKLVLDIYNSRDFHVEVKDDRTPVTEADKASSAFLVSSLRRLYPDIPIISEEANIPPLSTRQHWEHIWSIDPLDGTKEFITHNGRFCVNIGLLENGKSVFGIINDVLDNEILWGGRDVPTGMTRDGQPLPLEDDGPVPDNKLRVAVSRFHIIEWELRYIDYLRGLNYDVELVPLGASSKQCMVARGLVDICPKFAKCSEWDTAAGQAIVEAAGGLVVNVETNGELRYNKNGMLNPPLIFFNRRIHERIKAGDKTFLRFGKGNR